MNHKDESVRPDKSDTCQTSLSPVCDPCDHSVGMGVGRVRHRAACTTAAR